MAQSYTLSGPQTDGPFPVSPRSIVSLNCTGGTATVLYSAGQLVQSSAMVMWPLGICTSGGVLQDISQDTLWVSLQVFSGTATLTISDPDPANSRLPDWASVSINSSNIFYSGTSSETWVSSGRTGVASTAVPYYIGQVGSRIALDVVYNGPTNDLSAPDNAGSAWIDIGGPTDGTTSNPADPSQFSAQITNSEWLRLGKFSSANSSIGHVSMARYGTGVLRDLALQANATSGILGNVLVGTSVPDGTFSKLQVAGDVSLNKMYWKSISPNVAANTTQTQAAATVLSTFINVISTCANNGDAVRLQQLLQAGTNNRNFPVWVANHGVSTLAVFPFTNQQIGLNPLNSSVAISSGKSAWFHSISGTTWIMCMSA